MQINNGAALIILKNTIKYTYYKYLNFHQYNPTYSSEFTDKIFN
jgi:hypothetical protein